MQMGRQTNCIFTVHTISAIPLHYISCEGGQIGTSTDKLITLYFCSHKWFRMCLTAVRAGNFTFNQIMCTAAWYNADENVVHKQCTFSTKQLVKLYQTDRKNPNMKYQLRDQKNIVPSDSVFNKLLNCDVILIWPEIFCRTGPKLPKINRR